MLVVGTANVGVVEHTCWAPAVDLLALVSQRQLFICRLNWQKLWSQRVDAEVCERTCVPAGG
jgi:hypothetical protein